MRSVPMHVPCSWRRRRPVRGVPHASPRTGGAAIALGLWLCLSALHGAVFGDPRGFLTEERIEETTIRPGLVWTKATGVDQSGPQVLHVVRVNLGNPSLKLKALTGRRLLNRSAGQFVPRSTPSQMLRDEEALVAINTAFFDIGDTQAPQGLLVQDGMLLREPSSSRGSLIADEAGRVVQASPGWTAQVQFPTGRPTSLKGVNRNALASGETNLYLPPWDRSPGNQATFTAGQSVTEVIFTIEERRLPEDPAAETSLVGKVREVRVDAGAVSLRGNLAALTAAGAAGSPLQALRPGDRIGVRWRLASIPGMAESRLREAVSGGDVLIRDGVALSKGNALWTTAHPRSATGLSGDGTRLVMVLVEGRQSGVATGMSLHRLIELMQHLHCHQALNLDGGGSSVLAARSGEEPRVLSTPSDGSERYVPAGLGIVEAAEEPDPYFQDIRITPGRDGAAVTWDTPEAVTGRVRYGMQDYAEVYEGSALPASRNHLALLQGLQPGATYFLRLEADAPGGTRVSQPLAASLVEHPVVLQEALLLEGVWNTASDALSYQSAYRWSEQAGAAAVARPQLVTPGRYDVSAWMVPGANRAAARYEIVHDEGVLIRTLEPSGGGSGWRTIAENLFLTPYAGAEVRISHASGGVLAADALQFRLRTAAGEEAGVPPAWWRRHFFGDRAITPASDPDGDGYDLWQEYRWGTLPDRGASRPEIAIRRPGPNRIEILFAPHRPQRRYGLQSSRDLRSWQNERAVATERAPGRAGFELAAPATSAARFYRVVAE